MNKGWKHELSPRRLKRLDLCGGFSPIPPYKEMDEEVYCIHCRTLMWDYDGTDYWKPLPFDEFAQAHKPTAAWMKKHQNVPHDHARLSGRVLDQRSVLFVCRACGWWVAVESAKLPAVKWQFWYITLVAPAILKSLDLSDISLPVAEVRRYLMRRFEERVSLHPRKFEEVVGSVFKDHGYETLVTAYSRDGGIDVVMKGEDGSTIGVQVKRHRRSIGVQQIREFLGALVIEGHTRGVFVSSSEYQRGAQVLAEKCTRELIPIDLIGPDRFLKMLGVAQLDSFARPRACGLRKKSPPRFFAYSDFHLNSL